MKKHFLFRPVILLAALVVFAACGDDDNSNGELPPAGDQLTILNVGDSRVEGARPAFESYRYELWKNLVSNNWQVNFIGPLEDEASYPAFQGVAFDPDHAGVGGAVSEDVLSNLNFFLSTGSPRVVLMDIGGNDLLGGASASATIANVHRIINRLQSNNPSVTIFLEQIAPGKSDIMTAAFSQTFEDFNRQIAETATLKTTATSKVIAVDMATGWTDALLADDVHYNEAGAKVVADRYYQSMAANIAR